MVRKRSSVQFWEVAPFFYIILNSLEFFLKIILILILLFLFDYNKYSLTFLTFFVIIYVDKDSIITSKIWKYDYKLFFINIFL